MQRKFPGAAILIGAVLCATARPADAGDAQRARLAAKMQQVLEAHRARGEFPGAVMAMDDPDGNAVWVASGRTGPSRDSAAVDSRVPWVIGSTTKTFVAVVVLQLAQEGKLDLDRNIGRWFPQLPGATRITTRQLLQHTSGLKDYLDDSEAVKRDAARAWTPAKLIQVAASRGPIAKPGAVHHYSNTNYIVLGELIEKVTSRPWYVEVRARILQPLGMKRTGYLGAPAALEVGPGHGVVDGQIVDQGRRWHFSVGGAAGAMYSTAHDLMRFARALFQGRLLDEKRQAEMQTFVRAPDIGHVRQYYGLGLQKYEVNNLTLHGHMGTAAAHSSFVGFDPRSRTTVAVVTNCALPGASAIMAAEAVGKVTGRDVSPPPMPSASVGFTYFPYATLQQNGSRVGKVRVMSQRASLGHTLRFNEGQTSLELGASYERLQFDYRDLTHPMSSVHGVSLTAFLRQRLTDSWGLLFVAAPGYASDFGEASLDGVTLTLVGAGTYRFSDSLEIGLGVAMQNIFGEPLPMPVASVDWTITPRLWLKTVLPLSAELTWLPLDWLGLQATVTAMGNQYHGDPDTYNVGNPQMNYSAMAVGGGVRFFALPWLHLTVRGGYTVFRRFEFSDGREEADSFELKNGPVFGVDLGVGG